MEVEVYATLVGSAIAVVSAAAGYAFREWRNRASPFVAVTHIVGDVRLSDTVADIPEEVSAALDEAFYLDAISGRANMAKITAGLEENRQLVNVGPSILQRAEAALKALESNEPHAVICNRLAELLEYPNVSAYLGMAITKEHLKPTPSADDLPLKIPVHRSTQFGGCAVIGFPGRPAPLGMNFDEKYAEASFQPLIKLFETLDFPALIETLAGFIATMNAELAIARKATTALERILDENSLWEVVLFFANLQATPVLVEIHATLHVKDRTGAKFAAPCDMAVAQKSKSGEVVKRTASFPLVVASGTSATFGFYTRDAQKQMPRGQAFRDAYVNEQADAWLELSTYGVGFRRKRKVRTDRYTFTPRPVVR